jgi:hypothetical protein
MMKGAKTVVSDDGDGAEGALDGDGCSSLHKELRVMALLPAAKKTRGRNGGGSHREWRRWCTKLTVGENMKCGWLEEAREEW